MKTLEQLGISPTPWKKADDGMGYKDIWCNAPVTEDSEGENIIAEAIDAKDAHLIAAAPDLYEALYEAVTEKCTECNQINDYKSDIGIEWQMCKGRPVKKWRTALAKAAGESEVKDGKR